MDEINEVRQELRPNNTIYLEDELGDILWCYFVHLAVLESDGTIDSIESVFTSAFNKYNERASAFRNDSQKEWEEIKQKQKIKLEIKHREKYKK